MSFKCDGNILYIYKVDNPSRFGVAKIDEMGNVKCLVEKPQEFVSDEALVGIYYIKDVKELKRSLNFMMKNNIRTCNEFQLTDALQMMIENGCKFKTASVQVWLDCGLPETLLQTNTWLLQNKPGLNNIEEVESIDSIHNVKLISPCYIGKNVIIANSVIGPNVTIGDNCTVWNSVLKDCIVWNDESVCDANIEKRIVAKC